MRYGNTRYIRTFDRSIANPLDVLDKKVGLQNVCFFSSPRPAIRTANRPDSGLYKIPGGEFYSTAAPPLLNTKFLMATYGEGAR